MGVLYVPAGDDLPVATNLLVDQWSLYLKVAHQKAE